ncbi:hemolysin [Paracoccus halophilus]|uniref:Hemolysin n=1 Tax=Paracoccus halophilus TaxID=376733 RepID=A0A099EWI6_9RHOB|nr:hemolysin [Paracoccus halophilus]
MFTDRNCFPCFARGTMIDTESGPVAVEDLVPGMRVLTRDRGLQPLRWIGSRVLGSKMLNINPNMRPIRIRAGALGDGKPTRDLLVSPQHRVLVRSNIARKMFGTAEVLVAAKQLLQIEGIDIAHDLTTVEYFHFLFDRHEIVLSEGAETESLYTGKEALKSLGSSAQEEIFALFPELRTRPEDEAPEGARILASGRMGRKLAVRHAQHRKLLVHDIRGV